MLSVGAFLIVFMGASAILNLLLCRPAKANDRLLPVTAERSDASPVPGPEPAQSQSLIPPTQLLANLRAAFALIDLDGGGTLTRGELVRGCREKERVRLLMGLPRNLRGDKESQERFAALFHKLDRNESDDVSEDEFVAYFSSVEGQAAMERFSAVPSWRTAALKLKLDPYGPPEERSHEGFLLWASEARFEMRMPDEWMDERKRGGHALSTQLAQWQVLGDGLTHEELERLRAARKKDLETKAAFPVRDLRIERKRMQSVLEDRVDMLYQPPSAETLRYQLALQGSATSTVADSSATDRVSSEEKDANMQ